MDERGGVLRNFTNLLFPRAKWNTAQVKPLLPAASQVIKLIKANKLGKKGLREYLKTLYQKAHLVAIPMFTEYKMSLLTALRVLKVQVKKLRDELGTRWSAYDSNMLFLPRRK